MKLSKLIEMLMIYQLDAKEDLDAFISLPHNEYLEIHHVGYDIIKDIVLFMTESNRNIK